MPLVHASAATWLVAVSAAAGVLPVASAGEAAAAELSRGHEQEAHPGSAGAETATWGGDEPGVGRPVDPQTGDFPPRYSTHNDLALAALIAEALARNPRVRAASFRHQAALQRVPQAEALPDPTFALTQYAIAPQTRVGPQTTMLSVSQRLPWFGKLSNQGDIAAAGAGAEGQLLQARRADVVLQVKLAYYELGYVDRALKITEEEEHLLSHYETLARAQYSQGVGLQQAAVRLQAEITGVLNRRQELLRQRVDAEAALNALRVQPADASMSSSAQPGRMWPAGGTSRGRRIRPWITEPMSSGSPSARASPSIGRSMTPAFERPPSGCPRRGRCTGIC